ncbi:MAG TPA: GatB/YqeY domain-containing protein, partial [Gammaproteobacteria bacterium]
ETLDDDAVLSVLEKMVKQRQDSVAQFRKGNRQDLVEQEQAEIDVLEEFLPEKLDEAATEALVDEAIAATGADSPKDMGRVMGEIKSRAGGQVDMGRVSTIVKARLTGS